MAQSFHPPGECPVCGDDVPRGAKACPGCGADERSGWDEDGSRYDGVDLPDEAFAEVSKSKPQPHWSRDRVWIALGVLLVVALVMTFIHR